MGPVEGRVDGVDGIRLGSMSDEAVGFGKMCITGSDVGPAYDLPAEKEKRERWGMTGLGMSCFFVARRDELAWRGLQRARGVSNLSEKEIVSTMHVDVDHILIWIYVRPASGFAKSNM